MIPKTTSGGQPISHITHGPCRAGPTPGTALGVSNRACPSQWNNQLSYFTTNALNSPRAARLWCCATRRRRSSLCIHLPRPRPRSTRDHRANMPRRITVGVSIRVFPMARQAVLGGLCYMAHLPTDPPLPASNGALDPLQEQMLPPLSTPSRRTYADSCLAPRWPACGGPPSCPP